MKVSRRSLVPPFTVMEIIAAANARRAAGRRVLNLCMGEPSAGAPTAVLEAAKALLDVHPLGYTEAVGAPELRAEIAAHYRRWYDVDVDPARVAVTTGSSGAFLLAFLAAFEPGAAGPEVVAEALDLTVAWQRTL
jgi:aspartate/methionine/tyrosine aminotransferase